MKEAIANSAISTMVIVLIAIIMLVFLSSLAYTKAFKIKNRMIDIIESRNMGVEGKYTPEQVKNEIDELMKQVGYLYQRNPKSCPVDKDGNNAIISGTHYEYCIYKVNHARGYIYRVVAYMYFDIPLVKGVLKIPVKGDTLPFYQTIDIHRQVCTTRDDCGPGVKCNGGPCGY
jgi:hypothetical protein